MAKHEIPPGALAQIITNDAEVPRIYSAMERAILRSFAEDARKALIYTPTTLNPTQSAVKERFNICVQWLLQARNEFGFSLDRALARMHHYLRCTLDGIPIKPEEWGNRGYFVD